MGSASTGAYGYYDVDGPFIREFAAASKTDEGFATWADEWVYGVKDHEEYLNKLGVSRLEKLRANSYRKYSTKVKRGTR